ncbi:hypothetical protein DUC38_22490 [Salmonella enterica subsp. enterica serovar Saintpaul]|nr:hypothetical protein [Salmonella enterica subsp. enterica serovar Saintpaul]EDU1279992.1 hypothetical protein [Salmonella enterica subsp. enterica serovar Saintpaul]EEJ3860860.1 hypothetical protein [Salmonella enterica subsp. enterica serovar Saintpaul]
MTITKERLLKIQHWRETYGADSNVMLPAEEAAELARIALASLTAEPVAWTDEEELRDLRKVGFCEMFSVEPISKDADMLRFIPLYRHAQPTPVVPDGLRQALSNAGITAPESDEMLAATCEKYIQMLVTWVKDRKPFQPAPVVPEVLERLRSIVADPRALPRRKEWISGQQYSYVLLENVEAMVDEACRSAMLQSKYRDLSQPVDPQISEYEKIMLQAGWVMVPVEPTDEMIAAAMNCEDVLFNSDESFCVQFGNIYEAMLAVAPKPEVK